MAGHVARSRAALMVVAVCAWLGLAAPSVGQTIIYVNAAAGPGGNGMSWGTAYRDLELAISSANGSLDPVQVWVVSGTYRPSVECIAGVPHSRMFRLANMVSLTIAGGFAGTESSLDQREPTASPTIISADLGADDLPGFMNRLENAWRLFWVVSSGSVNFDRLVLSGGSAAGSGNPNTPELDAPLAGVAFCQNPSPINFRDCAFIENQARLISACIYTFGLSSQTLTIERCVFQGNRLTNSTDFPLEGVAVFDNNNSGTRMYSSLLSGNSGGDLLFASNDAHFTNLTVVNNVVGNVIEPSGSFGNRTHTLENSIVWNSGSLAFPSPTVDGVSVTCLVQGGLPVGWSGTAISDAPLLADIDGADGVPGTPDDDLRLTLASPALDSGTNAAVAGFGGDVERRPRVWDGNHDLVRVVDIGAYEFGSVSRLYVRAVGGGPGPWADAFIGSEGLRDALTIARVSEGFVREIWVSAGIYKPSPPGGSRGASFVLAEGAAVYGGFAGSETCSQSGTSPRTPRSCRATSTATTAVRRATTRRTVCTSFGLALVPARLRCSMGSSYATAMPISTLHSQPPKAGDSSSGTSGAPPIR